jgi:hypothetical protein
MRYLTRGWCDSDLDDDEVEAARAAYWARIDAIENRLPEPLLRLARHVNLHDGVIESVTWEPANKTLVLDVVASALKPPHQVQNVRITLGGALMGERRINSLRDVARDRESSILYWEVDLDDRGWSPDAPFILRLLFWPRDELSIDFAELTLAVEDRTDGRVRLSPYFLVVVPDEDEAG